MSKIGCKCGHVIVDQNDSLPYKASLLRDQEEDAFWDELRREIAPLVAAAESGDKAAIAKAYGALAPWVSAANALEDRISSIHASRQTTVYECQLCGRLLLEEAVGGRFVFYAPETGGYQGILSQESGETDHCD
jgi:hypothetical protein